MSGSVSHSVSDSVRSSLSDSRPRARAEQGAGSREQGSSEQGGSRNSDRDRALREIHPLDAMAVTLAMIRPDWSPTHIRAVLARSNGSTRDLARRALTLALDPDVRTPNGIENADMRRYDPTPVLPTVAEALNPQLCAHEFRVGACPVCRRQA